MIHLLSDRYARRLLEWARGPVLFAFDFDGTLAPIVADRRKARPRVSTLRLFERLCQSAPCAVITGRSRRDVSARLGAARVRFIVGNHGASYGDVTRSRAVTTRVLRAVRRRLACHAGIDIEAVGLSIALHYRSAPDPDAARTAIEAATADLPEAVRLVPGKMVLNLVPAGAPHKGDALERLLQEASLDSALFVGDDGTDEDVFGLRGPHDLLTVRVGSSRSSSAAFYLRDQREIDALLAILLHARRPSARSA